MSHLPPERLAALPDEPPTAAEAAHLESCERCAREWSAFDGLRALAGSEQARIGLPLTRWETLAPALHAEQLIASDGPVRDTLRAVRGSVRSGRGWLQAAAAILLVATGVALGRLSDGREPLPLSETERTAAVSDSIRAGDAIPTFRSVEEARLARSRYEQMYQTAALYLAEHDTATYTPDSPAAMRRRLATLDQVSETVREALHDSPYDPVINGYYLTTLGEREATLRQLNTTLPAGVRINSF